MLELRSVEEVDEDVVPLEVVVVVVVVVTVLIILSLPRNSQRMKAASIPTHHFLRTNSSHYSKTEKTLIFLNY